MKDLRKIDLKGKRVLVRCDFNVPLDEQGNISDDFRIRKVLPTINYLKEQGAKIVIISHLGRPNGQELKYGLRPVADHLGKLINSNIVFLDDAIGVNNEKEIDKLKPGEIALLENIRFYKEELENNLEFAKKLAKLGDIFVEEGFSVCHRQQASVVSLPKLLPSYPGFLLEEEIKVIKKVIDNPERPFVSIVGGVKISTKVKLLEKLLEKSDHVLVGGKIANSVLIVNGICVRDKWSEEEQKLAEAAKRLDLTNLKLHLPIDGVIALSSNPEDEYSRIGAVGTLRQDEDIFDIGPETVNKFKMIINLAKTIVWNGPLGYFEIPKFKNGTKEIMKAIAESSAYSVVGGGETAEIISREKMEDKFGHVSSGGEAMLDYIAGDTLPGIKVLEND